MEGVGERLSRVEATVSGEVQGVGYRYVVQGIARKLGVKGFVENAADGTVRVVAEASEQVLEAFVKKLEVREPPINVEKVESTYLKATGEFQSFRVGHGELVEEIVEGFASGLRYMNVSRQETKEGFKALSSEIGGMHEDMNKSFEQMSKRYETISINLTQAVKMIQEESANTRIELKRAVDNLSRLVEEFLKERHSHQ